MSATDSINELPSQVIRVNGMTQTKAINGGRRRSPRSMRRH